MDSLHAERQEWTAARNDFLARQHEVSWRAKLLIFKINFFQEGYFIWKMCPGQKMSSSVEKRDFEPTSFICKAKYDSVL